jgi:hypothetical protein
MANLRFAGMVRQNHEAMAPRARGLDQPQSAVVVRDYNIRQRRLTGHSP